MQLGKEEKEWERKMERDAKRGKRGEGEREGRNFLT